MTRDQLKNVLHDQKLSRLDILIILLSAEPSLPKQVKDIKELALSGGFRKIKTWNISDILTHSSGLTVRTSEGWELTSSGRERAVELGAHSGPITDVNAQLRATLADLKSQESATFVEETIKCLEAKYLRAAVVLSWVGAVSVLYDHIISNKLSEFNAEALRRDGRWRNATTTDDLARMKESDMLQVLEGISVIGKNVKQELEACLKLRNACGHPSSLSIGESRVAAHIEVLALNVFSKF